MSLRDLDSSLKSGGAPVYLVLGDAGLLVDRAVSLVETWAVERCGLPAFNHGVWRCSDGRAHEGLSVARTVPMMADKRVVVLRQIEQGDTPFFEALLDYLSSPSPTTTVIITGVKFPAVKKGGRAWSKKVQDAAKKVGVLSKHELKNMTPVPFAIDQAKSLGRGLGRREAQLLVDVVGRDPGRLASELEKLALYTHGRDAITAADIGEVCSMVAEEDVWVLTAALAARDADAALTSLHRLLEEGDAPHRLLGLIGWQLRTLLKIRDLVQRGASDRQIAGMVRMRGIDGAIRHARKAEAAGAPGPALVLERMARANREMNLHRGGSRHVLESLVVDLVSG